MFGCCIIAVNRISRIGTDHDEREIDEGFEADKSTRILSFTSGQQTSAKESRSETKSSGDHVVFHHDRLPILAVQKRAREFHTLCSMRRTIRFFSCDPVPQSVMEDIIATAGTAPSGAHKQPWHFSLVGNPQLKEQIRSIVEAEEQTNYDRRMKKSWIDDLKGMLSDIHQDLSHISKPYLTEAPWLIVVSKQMHEVDENGKKAGDHYYVPESVGIACGFLVAAIHNANLVTLTSTPMGAYSQISKVLNRPNHEKVFLLLPVGFPARNATVPYRKQQRKSLEQVMTVY